jgi:mRNA interferase MazF
MMENLLTTKNKIVLIPFPFDDLETTKVRPALCLSDPIDQHNHVILAFITSRVPDRLLESDLVIDSEDEDFSMTGLKVTSTLRLHRLITVTTALIRRELGELPLSMQKKVIDKLKELFGLTPNESATESPGDKKENDIAGEQEMD